MSAGVSFGYPTSNKDLIWNLDEINKRELACKFLYKFENLLCIYSSSVEQLYTNYSINMPSDDPSKIVILPNPYTFHDTFNHISASAIRDTGLHIVPGQVIGATGLYVMVRSRNRSEPPAPLPFKQALRKIIYTQQTKDPFLPILVKGDLRQFDTHTPCLHLHRIKITELSGVSEFNCSNIRASIVEKLKELHRNADQL
ncbi:hypothetical protein [Gynuella sunshinyii]|uniref:Uncharacterized protein n=1 Tax=Gynuella sunshinyii YC6258 TaxID=1445510 RepID=A0A0C5W2G5_9GAMM|nr:hypothetical protein [Gynuella sunshinyii]AJQ96869.1 hypothetical Protein YC6258_04837 [Gynuella sunshinyii YC6258]